LVLRALGRRVGPIDVPKVVVADPLGDDDLHLALYCCYELHYRGFAGVDPAWEWSPALLAIRAVLESAFEGGLLDAVGTIPPPSAADEELREVIAGASGPSLSAFMEQEGTLDHLRELCIHRSAYQLKEADPHTWALPRLTGRAKAAMVEIQSDEYGGGVEADMHATLFASTMRALGLDDQYGAYLDRLPGVTLATTNLISLFGLHRRWRGALVGHLAAFEMTSVTPMERYGRALSRLRVPSAGRRFYDVHVEADAWHEQLAAEGLVRGLTDHEPGLAADIVLGAKALLHVEQRFARHLLASWQAGETSLYQH
jgi:hypothetical protein